MELSNKVRANNENMIFMVNSSLSKCLAAFHNSPPRINALVRSRQAASETRGCLRADVELPGGTLLHVFNVHMGTAFLERRKQGRKLVSQEILHRTELPGPRIVLGDFNEWTRGLTSRLLREQFVTPNLRDHINRSRTYPGVLPFLHLDHIYFDSELHLHHLTLHKTRRSLIASDHLPLIADFSLPAIIRNNNSYDNWSAVAS